MRVRVRVSWQLWHREDSRAQSYPWSLCVANTCSKQEAYELPSASFILGVHPHIHPCHQRKGSHYHHVDMLLEILSFLL